MSSSTPTGWARSPTAPSLFALFGTGHLAITFDQATSGERYQGIVPLDGNSIAEAAESYFFQSEQIPSLIRLGSAHVADGRCIAGGLFLQHLPEGEDGRERLHTRLDHPEWEHVAALGGTMGADELADPALPLETLVWRLFNEEEEVRILDATPLAKGCRCDTALYRRRCSPSFRPRSAPRWPMTTASSTSTAPSARPSFRCRSPTSFRNRYCKARLAAAHMIFARLAPVGRGRSSGR